MQAFSYVRAERVDDALAALQRPGTKLLGGGTNLLDLMKGDVEQPVVLVDITRLPLADIREAADRGVRIGALARNSETANHPLIRARLGMTGRMVCIGINSGVKDGRRSFVRMGWAALRTPLIPVLSLFESNSGIFGINALHVLPDPFWIDRLSHAFRGIAELGLVPHVGKVFPATQVADAHACLETKQATGKVLLAW